MKILKTIAAVFTGLLAAMKSFGLTEAQLIVARLKKSDIGLRVAADVEFFATGTTVMSGPEKFAKVLERILPYVENRTGLIDQAEGIARELVQSVFNDVVTAAKAELPKVLDKLGVK